MVVPSHATAVLSVAIFLVEVMCCCQNTNGQGLG